MGAKIRSASDGLNYYNAIVIIYIYLCSCQSIEHYMMSFFKKEMHHELNARQRTAYNRRAYYESNNYM